MTEVFHLNSSKPNGRSFSMCVATAVMTAGHREEREASEMNREYHGGTDRHG